MQKALVALLISLGPAFAGELPSVPEISETVTGSPIYAVNKGNQPKAVPVDCIYQTHCGYVNECGYTSCFQVYKCWESCDPYNPIPAPDGDCEVAPNTDSIIVCD